MQGRSKQKNWSVSALKRRGWTPELIKALLPEPQLVYRPNAKGKMRVWAKADVLAAEATAEFASGRAESSAAGQHQAAGLLKAAWDAAGHDPGTAGRLAGHYHGAIIKLLGAGRQKPLGARQAVSRMAEFLALSRRCDAARVPEIMKNFVRAAAWLGRDECGETGRRVLAEYPAVLEAAAGRVLGDFCAAQPEADAEALVSARGFPRTLLLGEGLGRVWSTWYVPQAIRTSLKLLIALNPKDEYPAARAMRRSFILHIGGTNTGKTHDALERLMCARTGVYLAPLRLLALEAQETLLDARVDCSLTTGEEEDVREGDTHLAATAEKLPLERRFDCAVIDECQMIADPQRGYAWTRAILGVLAPEIHLCAAPEAKDILIRLIESCGDSWELQVHERTTPLICMQRTTDFRRVEPGDALITFSKAGVLSVAEDLRGQGKEPAIIYGALPYSTRRRQMDGFLNGDMEYVVSTDAIGMGLNLPIRRVIFMETEKFDGTERRPLKPEEIKQIAGRAGRRGMYPRGYVGATENLEYIRAGLEAVTPPIRHAVAGFSELVLDVDYDLLEVLTEWNKLPTVEPYVKLDISRYLTVITRLREKGFSLPREQELRAANIPFDENEDALWELFFSFVRRYLAGEEIEQPGLSSSEPTLPELELYYRKLDLYFSFARAFGLEVDADALYDTRERTADAINEILLHRLRNNIRFCARCGRSLPLHHRGRLCDDCWRAVQKKRSGGGHNYHKE